jgi:hypothetical protein
MTSLVTALSHARRASNRRSCDRWCHKARLKQDWRKEESDGDEEVIL